MPNGVARAVRYSLKYQSFRGSRPLEPNLCYNRGTRGDAMRLIGIMLGIALCLWGLGYAQEEQPLINYAAGIGEFEHDEDPEGRGDNISDGFTWTGALDIFTPVKDLNEFISGRGSQRINFSRNGSGTSTCAMTLILLFPTEMYPQPGETVRISFWLKTANWQNAQYRALAQDHSGGNSVTLLNATNPLPEWTRFEYTYTIPNATPNGMRVRFEITALSGQSSGTIWLDNLEIYGSKRWEPPVQRSVKLYTYFHPTQMPLANGDWIFYARNFDAVGTFNSTVYLRQMKVYRPEIVTFAYYMAFGSIDSASGWPARDPFGYQYCNQNHPEWFALNVLGQRVRFGGNIYMMDVGIPECAQWAANNMRARAERANMAVDVFKFDAFVDFTRSYNLMRYPTPASRVAAARKYLMKVKETMADYDTKIILNAAGDPYVRGRTNTFMITEGLVDGFLIEQFSTAIFSFPADALSFNAFQSHVTTIPQFPNAIRVIYDGYPANPQRARPVKIYALGCFLLISDENTYLYLDTHYYENGVNGQRAWRPDEDFDVPLGQPTGPYQVYFQSSDYAGGLYYRPFENGFVLVNPTGNVRVSVPGRVNPIWKDGAVFTWTLDDIYWELLSGETYPAGTKIKLYPKQARIFVRQGQALQNYPPAQRPRRKPEGKPQLIPGGKPELKPRR